jgi:hypothetical protein
VSESHAIEQPDRERIIVETRTTLTVPLGDRHFGAVKLSRVMGLYPRDL